jgi:hypothetical protein
MLNSFSFHSQFIRCTAANDSASLWCLKSMDSYTRIGKLFSNLIEHKLRAFRRILTLILSHLSSTSWSHDKNNRPLYRDLAFFSFSSCSGVSKLYTFK